MDLPKPTSHVRFFVQLLMYDSLWMELTLPLRQTIRSFSSREKMSYDRSPRACIPNNIFNLWGGDFSLVQKYTYCLLHDKWYERIGVWRFSPAALEAERCGSWIVSQWLLVIHVSSASIPPVICSIAFLLTWTRKVDKVERKAPWRKDLWVNCGSMLVLKSAQADEAQNRALAVPNVTVENSDLRTSSATKKCCRAKEKVSRSPHRVQECPNKLKTQRYGDNESTMNLVESKWIW